MKLREKIDYAKFMNSVAKCKKDVFFHSADGDCLNLKSSLSRFLFSVISSHQEIIASGEVLCQNEADEQFLKEYFV